jgi:hypothetical protein
MLTKNFCSNIFCGNFFGTLVWMHRSHVVHYGGGGGG